jgi:signal transduction histidine kinase
MGIVSAAHPRSASEDTDLVALLPVLGHELRTPLTALKGQVQLMQRRLRRQEGREADLADLDRVAALLTRMHHQLDIINTAARLAQDTLSVSPEPTDLSALIERTVSAHQSSFVRCAIVVDLPPEAITGWWDGRLIGHVLYELLGNAIRFSPPDATIRVRAYVDDGQARVEVADEGIGVPEPDRAAIFEYGQRGSNTQTYSGAGLGLYAAQGIVARHGGSIGIEPRAEGGSVFWFTLPL